RIHRRSGDLHGSPRGTSGRPPSALLSQLLLCPLQPVRHPHLAVHRCRGGEVLLRLLTLARALVELAEAEVAVGDEGAHTKLLGQDGSLPIVGCGLRALWRLAPCGDLTEKPERICLVAVFLVRTGEREYSLGEGVRLL